MKNKIETWFAAQGIFRISAFIVMIFVYAAGVGLAAECQDYRDSLFILFALNALTSMVAAAAFCFKSTK